MNQRLQGAVLKTRFIFLAVLVWVCWFLLQIDSGFSWVLLMFAAMVVLGSYLILTLFGMFDGFRIRFEVRDSILIVLVMFVVSLLLQLVIFEHSWEFLTTTIMQSFINSVCLGVGIWYFELLRDLPLQSSRPFRVVIDIEDAEKRRATQSLLRDHWPRREVAFYSYKQLKRYRSMFKDGSAFDLVVISKAHRRTMLEQIELLDIHLKGVPVVERAALVKAITGRVALNETDMWLFLAEANPQNRLLRSVRAFRAAAEPMLAGMLLVVLTPLVLLTAIVIRVSSPGSVLYSQKRLGYRGKEFTLYKFRSMASDAESEGPRFSGMEDERVTPLGKFLRSSRLDELPQLYNIMRGEMSFIGPRPERPEMYSLLKQEIPLFPLRLLVRPGITGWAQVQYGYASGVEESALKLGYDLFYIQNMSLRLDVKVMFLTLLAIVGGVKAERLRIHATRTGKSVTTARV
jgi:lipopolysaccharide/colanic/teichoic acid biosynthesis glycosyltransferase